jgi:hypothetical protein
VTSRAGRRFLRVTGWLLTPLVVWAASFLGGWVGASIAGDLGVMVLGGVIGGTVGVAGWIWLMRRWRN